MKLLKRLPKVFVGFIGGFLIGVVAVFALPVASALEAYKMDQWFWDSF